MFQTFTQYDLRFKNFYKFDKDRTACSLFSLITTYNYMQNGDISKNQHEKNIYSGIMNYMKKDIPKYMLFEELLLLTSISLSGESVGGTTPELITQGILGYDNIFKPYNYDQNYAVVFLKNRNFIVVMVKQTENGKRYFLRDCHETTQFDFDNFELLRIFLDKTYQFESLTIAGGVHIPEFSNIEYVVIDQPFSLNNIDPNFDKVLIGEGQLEFEIDSNMQPGSLQFQNLNNSYNYDEEMAFALQMQEDNDENDDYLSLI